MPKLTIIGNHNLQIDNYRGLKEYTANLIRLGAKGMSLEIYGEDLIITKIDAETIFLEGNIAKLLLITSQKSRAAKEKKHGIQ